MSSSRPARLSLVAPLFLASGGTALLYQVAFGKKLATIFGATAYAVSAVLAAFMGGLALGSWLGGRLGARIERPLRAYGIAEIVVAAVCAVTPSFFDAVAAAYLPAARAVPDSLALISVVRGVITALIVVVPTIAMGLTLPMLSRAVAGRGDDADASEASRRRLALLYAINTAGGAAGALASAYLVLPALGVYNTMRAAALVNLVIGSIAVVAGRAERVPPPEQVRASGRVAPLWLGLAAASGILVFAAEVVDTHLLALLIGNSAYAFGLMLAAFLSCLSLGAALAQPLDRRFAGAALPIALVASALALLVTIPLWGQLPSLFLFAGQRVSSWLGREAVRAVAALSVLLLPTICMGLTFPLLLRRVAAERDVAARVGVLTAVNTAGSIAGSLLCGYLVLSWLGSEWMLRAIALAFAACAVIAADGRRRNRTALAGAGCVALALLVPRWDMKHMTSGANVYFDAQLPAEELVYVREDVHGGLTSVARNGEVLTLYTNGKFQGNDGSEVTAQRSFAHFPSMFVRDYRRALVIGLGTGTTLGTVAAYPYAHIDVAEISPAIVEAAGRYFSGPNRDALSDPRVSLKMNDGRNVLLLATEPYDLVTIEVSSVWFAGAANLYSAEFYALVRDRLTPSGVLQQWVQLHHIHRRELAITLNTLRSAFSHVALFVSGGQGIVVAANAPLLASRERLKALAREPAIAETLGGHSLVDLLGRLMLSDAELDRFIADSLERGAPALSTDENLYLEYATPKGNVMGYTASITAMYDLLSTYRRPDPVEPHLTN